MEIKVNREITHDITFCVMFHEPDIKFLNGCLASIPSGYPIILQYNKPTETIPVNLPVPQDFSFINEKYKTSKLKMINYEFAKMKNANEYNFIQNTFSFAEARNNNKKYAETKWVFFLDADERLCADADELEAIEFLPDDIHGLLVGLASYSMPSPNQIIGERSIVSGLRIIRNLPEYQFSYRAHEHLSLEECILQYPVKIAEIPILIKHNGYNFENDNQIKAKYFRNIGLNSDDLIKNPKNKAILSKVHSAIMDLWLRGHIQKINDYKLMEIKKSFVYMKKFFNLEITVELGSVFDNIASICGEIIKKADNVENLARLMPYLDLLIELNYFKAGFNYELYKYRILQKLS